MSEYMRSFEGCCHCGAIGFTFRTSRDPWSWPVRACQCGFCRAHGARTTTDPAGLVEFHVHDPEALVRYRFGLRSADFLLCGHCGTYVGAVLEGEEGGFATLNINTIAAAAAAGEAVPISYDGESPDERRARRERAWTPVAGGIPCAAPVRAS